MPLNRRKFTGWIPLISWIVVISMILGMGLLLNNLTIAEPDNPIGRSALEIPQEAGPETQPTEPTQPATEPSEPMQTEPQDQPTDPTQGTDPGSGTPDSPQDPSGGADDPDGPAVPGGEGDGALDDDEMRIVTDLSDRVITFDELTGDKLRFYAYIANGEADMYLRVKIRSSQTSYNGTYLTATGRDYEATLARQENNYITIYLKQGSATISEVTYVVRYVAKNASAEEPTVGPHPPVVSTNLDDFSGTMTNRNFTFIVSAKNYHNSAIPSSNILVTMDGAVVRNPTGSGAFEYQLYFPDPTEGDFEEHHITVLVWDEEGNSTYREFTVTYGYKDAGSATGTAWIYIDATTVGLDPDTLGGGYKYIIRQDVPASYAVLEALQALGYTADYGRTPDDGFYLERIRRAGMCDYAQVPDNLWAKILDDGLALTGQKYADSLGAYDYTQGSGWMYSVNGVLYAGKSMADWSLTDGDVLYLRFTLAYGKDIGGYVSQGGSYGSLPTYCGRWLYGTYYDEHDWGESTIIREPTCTEPGLQARVCAVCGDRDAQAELPALGHDYHETERQDPTEDADGWIDFACARCGETKREILPKPEPAEPSEPSVPEPEPTTPPPEEDEDPEPTEEETP